MASSRASRPWWRPAPCTDESDLVGYLMGEPGGAIDRDTRTRFFSLIDKCPEWDSSALAATEVMLDGDEPQMALSIAFALMKARWARGGLPRVRWLRAPGIPAGGRQDRPG
jgi:hypothetical protein